MGHLSLVASLDATSAAVLHAKQHIVTHFHTNNTCAADTRLIFTEQAGAEQVIIKQAHHKVHRSLRLIQPMWPQEVTNRVQRHIVNDTCLVCSHTFCKHEGQPGKTGTLWVEYEPGDQDVGLTNLLTGLVSQSTQKVQSCCFIAPLNFRKLQT